MKENVLNRITKETFDFLWFSYFGITAKAAEDMNEDKRIMLCAQRAYLDLCITLEFVKDGKKDKNNISEEEKVRRLNEIIALQVELSHESNKRDIGKTFEVLIEGYSKRSRDKFCGRSSQNKMIVFPKSGHKIGDLVMVRVTEVTAATLIGEVIEK